MSKPEILMMGAYPDADMLALEQAYRVHKFWLAEDRDAFVAARASGIRAIATRGDLGASAVLMQQLPKLEIIGCFGVGTDAIDLDHARAYGIKVSNTPDVLTGDVADLGIALALAVTRQIPAGDVLVIAPPYIVEKSHIDTLVNTLADSIKKHA